MWPNSFVVHGGKKFLVSSIQSARIEAGYDICKKKKRDSKVNVIKLHKDKLKGWTKSLRKFTTFSAAWDYELVLRTLKIHIDPDIYFGIWNATTHKDHQCQKQVGSICLETLLEAHAGPNEEMIENALRDPKADPQCAYHHLARISELHSGHVTSEEPFQYES